MPLHGSMLPLNDLGLLGCRSSTHILHLQSGFLAQMSAHVGEFIIAEAAQVGIDQLYVDELSAYFTCNCLPAYCGRVACTL